MQPAAQYLIAVFGVVGIGCASIVTLEVARPEGYNAQAAYAIVGIVTTVITVLLGILKSISNGQAIEEAKLTAAIAATETRAARHEVPAKTAEAVRGVLAEASREPPP
jgi:predicted exporter